jgi:uncharacterized protein (TIGR00369 family)
MMAELEPLLDITDVQRFLEAEFPQVAADYQILEIAPKRLKLRLVPSEKHLRPGGTVSGPTLFSIADCAVYLAIIAHVGEEALAVTTGASIDFMRKPAADADLICDVELLKLGRGLVVGDAAITSAGQPGLVARATLTYSRPRK